jgi:CubicO group peptidase (beta-lactamase class C family)
MQLVEAGKLELDAPVQRYLPWFRVADPEASARITVRHLLNQTSGLSTVLDPGSEAFYPSLEEQVRALADAKLDAEPGARYQYFNHNYDTLGLLVEKASGQSYAEYLREHICKPLGLENTTADPAAISHLVQAYTQVFSFPVKARQTVHVDAMPSGYLTSTVADSARYLTALMNGGELDGQRVISPESLKMMFTPPEGIKSPYGMGWMEIDDPDLGGKAYYHAGDIDYFASQYLMIPEKGIGLVLLYNQDSMLSMIAEQEQILQGTVAVLLGETPKQGGEVWPGLVLGGVVLLDLLNHLRLFARVKRLAFRPRRWWTWLRVVGMDLVFPAGVLLFAPSLIANAFGETASWADLFSVMPDVGGWLVVGSALALVRGAVELGVLVRGKAHVL